ncbi:helix-turn-helix transcriptional regulator [Furfurilactobacillus sp. WILCCON 0119]
MREWLYGIRKKNNLTQKEMAVRLGIPLTTYASYEQAHRTPSVESAQELASKLDTDWTYFFTKEVRDTSTKINKAKQNA